jgi:hypothetical protein
MKNALSTAQGTAFNKSLNCREIFKLSSNAPADSSEVRAKPKRKNRHGHAHCGESGLG